MNTLDRILRIIYKEIPLSEFINKKMGYCPDENKHMAFNNCFDLMDEKFRDVINTSYLKIYPNNYNYDEINYMLDDVINSINGNSAINNMSNSFASSSVKKCNSIKLFLYVSDQLLYMNENKVKVHFDELLELNGFINKIDDNILLAAKLALERRDVNNHDNFRILHDNSRLNRILSNGISENHMHLKGSGYTSAMNWYEFCKLDAFEQTDFRKTAKSIISDKGKENDDDEVISFYKIRYIKYFLYQKLSHENETIYEYDILSLLTYDTYESYYLFASKNKTEFEILEQSFYNHYEVNTKLKDNIRKYFLIDRMFLSELFSWYLSGRMDELSLYLFNLYLLATSKFKMIFSQDNIGMGFEKFKNSENIKSSFLKNYDFEIYKSVFDKYHEEKNVKKIEFRIAPKTKAGDYAKLIDELNNANKIIMKSPNLLDENKFDYGIIVHYIKFKDEFNYRQGVSRKEQAYHKLNTQCNTLINFFSSYDSFKNKEFQNKYVSKIVGIDTANYEFNCRPELFGYIYRRQREEIYSSHNLKFTYHVGEDFTTLADGLRAIDEVIEFLNFNRGDRLGHALALGLDVDKYFKTKRRKVVQNLESYIDDIIWMKNMIISENINELNSVIKNKMCTVKDITNFLDTEFEEYFSQYNSPEFSIYDYYCSYKLRGDYPFVYGEINNFYNASLANNYDNDEFYKNMVIKYKIKLNHKSTNHKKYFLNAKARTLYFRYHFSKDYKLKHDKILNIDIDDLYIEAVRLSQFALRKKLYNLEIGIESNPSSNRKISFISKYIELPFINFNKKYIDDNAAYNLSTSINTDDSGIFQTDLSLEYAYVVATLKREGYDIESIYEYIDYIRDISMKQSFLN